jgi:hypothetical protein
MPAVEQCPYQRASLWASVDPLLAPAICGHGPTGRATVTGLRVACPKCGREIHQVARHCKHCHAVLGRRDVMDEPVVPVEARRRSRLPIIAVALASVAAVLLVVALVRRGRTAEPAVGPGSSGSGSDDLGAPAPESLVDPAVVAMFVAVCRYEVGCGVGSLVTCDQIERTMRQMPKKLQYKPCTTVNEDLAKQCVTTLGSLPSCRDFAKSLALTDLQHALDRVTPCRRACEP